MRFCINHPLHFTLNKCKVLSFDLIYPRVKSTLIFLLHCHWKLQRQSSRHCFEIYFWCFPPSALLSLEVLYEIWQHINLTSGGRTETPSRVSGVYSCIPVMSDSCWSPPPRVSLFTSSSCDCSSWAPALCRSSPSLLSPSSPFWAARATQTAALPAAARRAGRRDGASWSGGGRQRERVVGWQSVAD